jgi:hypothetical protein
MILVGRGGLNLKPHAMEGIMTAIQAANHHVVSVRDVKEDAAPTPRAAAPASLGSKKALWAGRVMSGLAVLFLLFDATIKVLELPPTVEGTTQLGYRACGLGTWAELSQPTCESVTRCSATCSSRSMSQHSSGLGFGCAMKSFAPFFRSEPASESGGHQLYQTFRPMSSRPSESQLSTYPKERVMAEKHSRKIFVNLAVRDLKKSMEFFSKLGFEKNPKFTDDKAACMVISEEAYVMLLREPFFKTFTQRELCDTTKHTDRTAAPSALTAILPDFRPNGVTRPTPL